MGQAEAQSIQIIIVITHCRMNRLDGRFAATVFRVGNFDSPRVLFTANLANQAQVKGQPVILGKTDENAGCVCGLHSLVVCQCPVTRTGTVRPKVPRYVFVTLPFGGETNSREAFLNCAAFYLFILHYEDACPPVVGTRADGPPLPTVEAMARSISTRIQVRGRGGNQNLELEPRC